MGIQQLHQCGLETAQDKNLSPFLSFLFVLHARGYCHLQHKLGSMCQCHSNPTCRRQRRAHKSQVQAKLADDIKCSIYNKHLPGICWDSGQECNTFYFFLRIFLILMGVLPCPAVWACLFLVMHVLRDSKCHPIVTLPDDVILLWCSYVVMMC